MNSIDTAVSFLNLIVRPGQGFWVYGILGGFYQGIRYFFPKCGYKVFFFSEFLVFCIKRRNVGFFFLFCKCLCHIHSDSSCVTFINH